MDNDPIKTTVEELRKLIAIQNFVGEPVSTEDKLLMPVMKMNVAFGAGKGINKVAEESESSGMGGGAGASVEPIAMVVVTKDVEGSEGIKSLNLTKGNPTNKAISDIGLIATELVKNALKTFSNKKGDAEEAEEVKATENAKEEKVNVEIVDKDEKNSKK